MKNTDILDLFGKDLIYEVRDYALDQLHNSITKDQNTQKKRDFLEKFKNLSPTQQEFFTNSCTEMIDITIHYFLWFIEGSDNFDLVYSSEKKSTSLKEISDGLCGELYSEEGWIKKYSKYSPTDQNI